MALWMRIVRAVAACCALACCTGGGAASRTEFVSLSIAPPMATVVAGRSLQLAALASDRDGVVRDVTQRVEWSQAGSAGILDVASARLTGLREGSVAISIRDGELEASTTVSVLAAVLEQVEVSPHDPTLALGTSTACTATAVYSDGVRVDVTQQAVWSSDAPGVASVATPGWIQGDGVGVARVRAEFGGRDGATQVTVTSAVLVSLQIDPPHPSIPIGLGVALTATGTFSDHSVQDLTLSADWVSLSAGVASVGNTGGTKGQVTSVALGAATVRASYGGFQATTQVQVTAAVLQSIAVTPTLPSIALGTSQAFVATGTFSDSSVQNVTALATWASSNPSVATISNGSGTEGRASSVSQGTTNIVAVVGAIQGATDLTVTAATLVSIAVTPANPSIALGTSQPFVATGTYTDASQQDLTSTALWSSSNIGVATVSNAPGSEGEAASVAQGSTVVGATVGAIQGSTTLTVTAATLVSLSVTPSAPSIALGTSQAFVATGTYTDASQQDLTATATWSSSDTGVATISNAGGSEGVATSAGQGSTTIQAAVGATTGDTVLTVTPATLVSIAVTPSDPSVGVSSTVQLTATGTYSDATQQDRTTSVTWASNNSSVATVSNGSGTEGEVTGVATGSATVSATEGAVQGSVTVTVAPLAFRAASSAGEGNGVLSLVIDTPVGSVVGDAMFAFVAIRPHDAVVTPPSGWTLVRSEANVAGDTNALYVYRKVVAVGEAASHSWTFDQSSGSAGGILAVSGADPAAPVDAQGGQSTVSGLTHTAPGITTTASETLLLSAHAYASSQPWTPPAGMTEVVDVASQPAGSAGISLECNWEAWSPAGATGDRAATAPSQADTGNAVLLGIRP